MQVEVTLTEDNPGDLALTLGRPDKRANGPRLGNHLRETVLAQLSKRIGKKILNRYGKGSSLVIRDSSGVDWDWEHVREDVRIMLRDRINPFDMGIWILNRTKTRLVRLT